MKEGVNYLQILRDLQNVIRDKWHDVDTRHETVGIRKSHILVEKAFSNSGKGEWRQKIPRQN